MDIDLEKYNYTCYIVGGGYSLKNFDFSLLKDKFVIGINASYLKIPWASILYLTDPPFINQHLKGLKEFKGLIYQGALNLNNPRKIDVVDKQWHLTGANGYETKEGCLRHGSNSSYAALNMAAAHLKFKTIYLMGVDCKWADYGNKNTSHWHNDTHPHQRRDGEATFKKFIENYNTIKKPLKDAGVEVINVNTPEGTDLKVFPIKSVEEVFNLKK